MPQPLSQRTRCRQRVYAVMRCKSLIFVSPQHIQIQRVYLFNLCGQPPHAGRRGKGPQHPILRIQH